MSVAVMFLGGPMIQHVQCQEVNPAIVPAAKPSNKTRQEPGESPPQTLPPGYRLAGTDRQTALQELCQATADTGLLSGAVLVADQGKVIYKQAFGNANHEWDLPNTVDTKFRIGSVSKQFCSLLVMQLVQEGKLHLDDTIGDHLSYYRKDTANRITIHHLMAHQSGIPDFTSGFGFRQTTGRLGFDPDEFIKLHCSGNLTHPPGTIYSYCNAGYCILGRIIERVTRKSFEHNLRQRILTPLGMNNSGFDRNRTVLSKRASGYLRGPFGIENADYIHMDTPPGGAGALYSTVEDLFLWDRSLYTDTLLNKANRDAMFKPNADVPEVAAAGGRPRSNYGYGWQISTRTHPVTRRRTKSIYHGGAINGFRAMEHRLVDDDAFVVVLCNLGDGGQSPDVWNAVLRLSGELIHVVTDQPYRMPGKARLTQDQRMYNLIKSDGVESAIQWFQSNGKSAKWGGTFSALVTRLIKDGRLDAALRMMELDVQMTPKKVWLLRKTAATFLQSGRPEKAIQYARQGLQLKPEDQEMQRILSDARRDLPRQE